MVLEQVLDRTFVRKHVFFAFILAIVYVFISFGVQEVFFPGQSLATVFLVTLFLVPSLHHLIVKEEHIERLGSSHLFRRHATIFKIHAGTFLGLLAGFMLLGFYVGQGLQYQYDQLLSSDLKHELIVSFLNEPYVRSLETTLAVFSHNLSYLLISIVLSIFYGVGVVFLLSFQASYVAAFLLHVIRMWNPSLAVISLGHVIPEIIGFMIAAMAGASLSRALIHEKVSGDRFRNVLQNTVLLMIVAILCILFAAFIETHVTTPLFQKIMA